jgi:putative ABC transport system ATP-binding protein
LIQVAGVCKRYGGTDDGIVALDNASVSVERGGFALLLGPSGSGKTTLLNLIAGMAEPDAGSVHVDGKDLGRMSDAERSRLRAETIGFVFQFQSMLPAQNALQNVMLPALFASGKPDGCAERAGALLERMGLGGRKSAYAHQLSTGQQRRVCMARALMNDPALLLCDEPTGDLDNETGSMIMNVLKECNDSGKTILMVTHNEHHLVYARSAYDLSEGRVIGRT